MPGFSLLSSEMQRASDTLRTAITGGVLGDDGFVITVPTFQWKGGNYPCIFLWNETGYMGPGGIAPLDDLTLQVLRSEFNKGDGPFPQRLDMVTFENRKFLIDIIQHTPGDYVKYTCVDQAKGT